MTTSFCKHCGATSTGNYCAVCGQSLKVKRLTISGIVHEIFHFFTHLEKGFLYTLKKLITSPGKMQREYVEGHRIKYQKPFSMFFLCATVSALIYYWINLALIKYYHAGSESAASFFHQYMVFLQIVMLPVYAAIAWLFFYDSKYNYAEILILLLYTLSLLLLLAAAIQLSRFMWPDLETRVIELPVILVYGVISNIFFFKDSPKWITIAKSILAIGAGFFLAGFVQDWLIEFLS